MVDSFRHKTLTLSGHFTIYLSGMFLLMVFLLTASWYTLTTTIDSYNSLTDREFIEIRRLVQLRDAMLASVEPVYNYLAWGSQEEAGLFEQLGEDVQQAYIDVLEMPSVTEDQRKLLMNARNEWLAAFNVGRAIFLITGPTADDESDRARASAMFQNHIAMATTLLYEAHNVRIANIEQYQKQIETRHRMMGGIMAACFLTALMIFAIASHTMARHILRPLNRLQEGIRLFGAGKLSHRIDVASRNELGDLADGINRMAESLERDQVALEQLAIRDSLTSLYNRREFERLLGEEIHRSRRYQHPLSMLLIDIDKFKNINDTLGHRAGDQALQLVATIINGVSRKGDVIARYGGDELAVLLPETPAEEAMILAERLRRKIAHERFRTEAGETLELTLSIGVATTGAEISTGSSLVDAADRAMYLAKTGGRNRVRRNEPAADALPRALP